MTNPPADWYDDPEDATKYRYWDGIRWTEHRSPKQVPPPPPSEGDRGSAWNLFPATFNAVGAAWRNLLLISLPNLVLSGILLVSVYLTIDQVFDGEVQAVLDRLGDGVMSADDERFLEAIDLTFPVPAFWALLAVAVLALPVNAIVSAALGRSTVAAIRGHELPPMDALRGGARRLGRIVGWSFVALAAIAASMVPLVFAPALLLLYLPLVIWLWPFGVAFFASLAIAPPGRSPFRQASELVRGRWRTAAARCLVLSLLWLCVGFGAGVVNQFFVFDLRASVIGSSLSGMIQGVLMTAAIASWWTEMQGPLDPELERPEPT